MNKSNKEPLIKAASIASLLVSSTLIIIKYFGWTETDSISILGSLADSLIDFLASIFVFIAISFSSLPADKEYRFGYGKSEGLVVFIQSLLIGISGLYVLNEAIQRFFHPSEINQPSVAVWIIFISIVLSMALILFQKYVVKISQSKAIESDQYHYLTDLYINISVLISVLVSGWTSYLFIDSLIGLFIAVFVIYSAINLLKKSFKILLDHELPNSERAQIKAIALTHPEVMGFHDLRTRDAGRNYVIQFHLELDPQMTLLHSHEVIEQVMEQVLDAFPDAEIIVHSDPLGIEEKRDPFE
jgi:ferrous-iron efflux pump FieF